jgi:hypothetical protein
MRTTRLSQTVSPFGVGAILDVEGESLMAADVSHWPERYTSRIESRRLEVSLGVTELRSPPSVPSYPSTRTPGIAYKRFPAWTFCQNCRRMRRLRMSDETGSPPRCPHCNGPLVPMRFIAIGRQRGHAMDIPWQQWAHSEPESADQRNCKSQDLLFQPRAVATEGLSSLEVLCAICGARRHLGDLTTPGILRRTGVRCTGAQPWQTPQQGGCDEILEVVQRGSTSVTLSETTTALDIPEPTVPVRDYEAEVRQHRNFDDLRSAPDGPRAGLFAELIAEEVGVSEELVFRLARSGPEVDDFVKQARAGLLSDEWLAFQQAIDHPDEPVGTPNFIVSLTSLADGSEGSSALLASRSFGSVLLVHRLREVRVLHGFHRYSYDSDLVDVNLGPRGRERWLPAVESFGEGVLLTLNEDTLSNWENDPRVISRVALLERRRQLSAIGSRLDGVSARLVLLHTLAHALIRELSFSCGYSAASLRERVYANAGEVPQAGILIYTAAGDAEGTLGGLVRQGESPRLLRTVMRTLERAAWCSSDPLCGESHGQGLDSLNLAACHGCSLVSETSCERGNMMLDRALLIGLPDVPGFFSEAIQSMREEAAARSD